MLNQSATILPFPKQPEVDAYTLSLANTFQRLTHHVRDNSMYGEGNSLFVSFSIDAKAWTKARNAGQLGHLYGTDLGNYLSRKGILKEYAVPTVDDKSRAKAGLKRIHVTYTLKART